MKKALLLVGLVLFAVCGYADTTYNNFNGYSDYWHPFGFPNTATYGELFTAPSNSDNVLSKFSFYLGDPYVTGNIVTGAYIATWTGSMAGTLLYDSGSFNYDNIGNEQLTWSPNVTLTPGGQYVMFLSISNFYGQSSGEAYVSQGGAISGLNGFVYNNNAGDFNSLFTNAWSGPLSPDWAVDLEFTTPEPGTLMMLGTGILGSLGILRRKLF